MMVAWMIATALMQPQVSGAGWRLPQWDQTPEQLRAVQPDIGMVAPNEDQQVFNYDYLARGEAIWQGIPVEVRYHFKARSRKLAVVKLIPVDTDRCAELGHEAIDQLGTVAQDPQKLSSMSAPGLIEREVTYHWDLPAQRSTAIYTDIKIRSFHVCHLLFRKR